MDKDGDAQIPWCFMPPETHFAIPEELKDAFMAFQKTRIPDDFDSELGKRFMPPPDKFEKVRRNDKKYILLPTALDYSYVFRGQGEFYPKCLPTIYRKQHTDIELFVERMRCVEFELFLKELPEVKDFERYNFYIDYIGLSQHYGLMTDVIDLTSSIDVALFFAMCDLSDDKTRYSAKKDDREYIGYIYAVSTWDDGNSKTLFEGKLNAIGMQPFYRPGNQCGFSYHLRQEEELKGLLYSFSYTKQDSERILKHFDQSVRLWHEDSISQAAREIADTEHFTHNAYNLAYKRYPTGPGYSELKAELRRLGYSFKQKQRWALSQGDWRKRLKEYTLKEGFQGINDVVQRQYRIGNKIYDCIDTSFLADYNILTSQSGCPAPAGYDAQVTRTAHKGYWAVSTSYMQALCQTQPNPVTHKVDKWTGDWRKDLVFDEIPKKLVPRLVPVPKRGNISEI